MLRGAPTVLWCCLYVASGCAAPRRPLAESRVARPQDDSAPSTEPAHGPVLLAYRRTGGIMGTDDRLVVWSDGFIHAGGRLFGTAAGRLSDDRMEELRSLLRDWDQWVSPALSHAADAFAVEIFHAGKCVAASDGSRNVPPGFSRLRGWLELTARETARK